MKIIDNKNRGFYWSNKAYYAAAFQKAKPSISFGLYSNDGENDIQGEMNIEWEDLGTTGIGARLRSFDDSWHILASFSDLINSMGKLNIKNVTQEDFVALLFLHGFKDLTQYTAP